MKKILFFICTCYALSITAQQADVLYIAPSGKIGIGTNSPQSTFHVNGQAKLDSNLNVSGTFQGAIIKGTDITGNSLSINSPTAKSNAIRINQGSFSMGGGSTSSTFAIDAAGITGGRFLVDNAGNATIGGNLTFRKTATIAGELNFTGDLTAQNGLTAQTYFYLGDSTKESSHRIKFQNKNHWWKIWTSGDQPSDSGLSVGSFELWDYYSTQNNKRLMVLPAGKILNKDPIIFDSGGNVWIPGAYVKGYSTAFTVADIIKFNNTGVLTSSKANADDSVKSEILNELKSGVLDQSILQKIETLIKTIEELNSKNEALQKRVAALEAKE